MSYLPHAHIGVTDDAGLQISKALLLNIVRRLYPLANRFRGLSHSITA